MRRDRIFDHHAPLPAASAVAARLAPALAELPHEELVILYLDGDFRFLQTTTLCGGEAVAMPIRRIAHEALAFGARAVLIAHNHPGGDPEPSRADRRATRQLAEALRALAIPLVDHIVFAGKEWVSFQRRGWL